MKSSLIGSFVLILLMCSELAAGSGDPGTPDTVRVGDYSYFGIRGDPDSIGIPVYLWNDEVLAGLCVGLTCDPPAVRITLRRFDSLSCVPDSFQHKSGPDSNRVIIGWISLDGETVIQPVIGGVAQYLATIYVHFSSPFRIREVCIDSTFMPPAAYFQLVGGEATAIYPQFRGCCFEKTAVDTIGDAVFGNLPQAYALSQNSPNPFNLSTAIEYAIPRPAQVTIAVYDILGREVRVLVDQPQRVGYGQVVWDGMDAFGREVSSGVYFYRLTANGHDETKKMVLLK